MIKLLCKVHRNNFSRPEKFRYLNAETATQNILSETSVRSIKPVIMASSLPAKLEIHRRSTKPPISAKYFYSLF